MTARVKARDLKIGMFVKLPTGWLNHPFLIGRFQIKSETQIHKIIDSGFTEVEIDVDRSEPGVMAPQEPASVDQVPKAPPHEFQDAEDAVVQIAASDLPPQAKAQAVYQQSLAIVEELFKRPTADFIGSSKRVVGRVVDLILSDDATAENLLKVSSHDQYTYMHSVNVGVYATALAKKTYNGTQNHNMRELGAGFFLHDLGKIHIDPLIIAKPGKLTPSEFDEMRKHPYESFEILKKTSQLSDECKVITLQHHEREDGTGYPFGLKGDEIHDYARICSIADVFDALTSKRSYREPLSAFGALQIMRDEMLGHFHSEMLRDFVMLFAAAA